MSALLDAIAESEKLELTEEQRNRLAFWYKAYMSDSRERWPEAVRRERNGDNTVTVRIPSDHNSPVFSRDGWGVVIKYPRDIILTHRIEAFGGSFERIKAVLETPYDRFRDAFFAAGLERRMVGTLGDHTIFETNGKRYAIQHKPLGYFEIWHQSSSIEFQRDIDFLAGKA